MALRIKIIALVFSLSAMLPVSALPQYTAREGRQCDSCHAYPFKTDKQEAWKDPDVADRKCNLSCQTCHLDPGGGGLRNVSGRYLAKAALPIMNSEARPWHDQNRNVMNFVYWLMTPKKQQTDKSATATSAAPPSEPAKATEKVEIPLTKPLPAKFKTHEMPLFHSKEDFTAFGTPFDAQRDRHVHGPEYGLYGNLNADPLFQFGGDLRFAYVKSNTLNVFFPMQADLGAKFHPVKHFTTAATLGLVGSANTTVRTRGANEMYTIRNAYLMYHELPYQMFVRAGMFQPTFGMRQEDHTAPVRRGFEMDLSQKYSSVMGIEAGLAPNYPYLTMSLFTNNGGKLASDPVQNYVINPQGFGAAVAAGWRDLAYGGGASFMMKQRPELYNGNLTAFSLDGYFNPGRFWILNPLSFTGEIAVGQYSGTSLASRTFYANYLEMAYLLFNGVNLKVNHHFYDADIQIKGNESGRFGFGLELIPFTWFKLLTEYRLAWAIDPKLAQSAGVGIVNPFDWLNDKQWVILTHIYF